MVPSIAGGPRLVYPVTVGPALKTRPTGTRVRGASGTAPEVVGVESEAGPTDGVPPAPAEPEQPAARTRTASRLPTVGEPAARSHIGPPYWLSNN